MSLELTNFDENHKGIFDRPNPIFSYCFILLRASTKTGWCMECVCVFVFVTVVDIICVCYVVTIYH